MGETVILRGPRGDGLRFASLRPWIHAVVCAASVDERGTNHAARSGAQAPDREGHAERHRDDTGAQGTHRSDARLRGSASTDAPHHSLGQEALERVARSSRSHPGSRIRWRRSRGVGDSCRVLQAATQGLNEQISGGSQA
jgi:hypothetical protein